MGNEASPPRGNIIFLNGTSSSGKSTLARHLQEMLHDPFLSYGFDNFFLMFGDKFLPWGDQKEQGATYVYHKDEQGRQLTAIQLSPNFYEMYHTISPAIVKAIVSKGGSIIIDEIMIYDGSFACWEEALKDESVVYVGVKVDLPVLEKRESERGDRPEGLSKYYAERTHRNISYDLVVDTEAETAEEIARKIIEVFENKYGRTIQSKL